MTERELTVLKGRESEIECKRKIARERALAYVTEQERKLTVSARERAPKSSKSRNYHFPVCRGTNLNRDFVTKSHVNLNRGI